MQFGIWTLLFVATGTMATSCVTTAECNESVRCPEGEVCYRYTCRRRCQETSDCSDGEICRRCEPSSGENRCFGIRARACVPADATTGDGE